MERKPRVAASAPLVPPEPAEPLLATAHQRLDQIWREATSSRFFGRIAIEVTFENGVAQLLYRKIDGRDKP